MKIFSWNVNGIRAVIQKGEFAKFIKTYQPDILCLQETKAKRGQAEIDLPDYEEFWNDADRPGYAGTAIFTKVKPNTVSFNSIGSDPIKDKYGDLAREGRVITLEFDNFFLLSVYSPHTKRELERLLLKQKWDKALLAYIKKLEKTKPVIAGGDLNIAHCEIDIANPKENEFNAGFTAEERADFDQFVNTGLIDTFRHFHPNEIGAYTYWTWRANARKRNIGWRIDYFLASKNIANKITAAEIHPKQMGSDHCPISITLELK
jgi:exodeoxyribonuclease-3